MKKSVNKLSLVLFAFLFLTCQRHDGRTGFESRLDEGWQLFSSETTNAQGSQISLPGFEPAVFHQIDIPATVMSGLIQNGYFGDVYYEARMEEIDREPFLVPWWYRKDFKVEGEPGKKFYTLNLEGVNYKANVWLNGTRIAGEDEILGPFGIWYLDVTDYVVQGDNTLALEVFPPKWGDLTIGFVDWSPEAPDHNMGLWRGVRLLETGAVSLKHPFVVSTVNTETLDQAAVTISTIVRNHSPEARKARVSAKFDNRKIYMDVQLEPNQEKEVVFSPEAFSRLRLSSPRLWWPVNMGEPNLYDMEITASLGREKSDRKSFRFGIRQIEDYRNEDDHLGFKVNGQKVLIRGGGWVDDMLLADPDEKVRAQVDYVKHMNMNTIRLEGFWGRNKTLYDRCDEQGVMLMIGWSCQWEWEYYSGRPEDDFIAIRDPDEQVHQARAYTDQVYWLRNHPSVFLWNFASDKLPPLELEMLLHEYMAVADTSRPLLSHCGSAVSEFTGTSGVKMHGPYDWVSPNYWYIDKQFGGAYGFNTETGPGPQVPTLETIRRMIPEDQLWPRGPLWDYHSGRFEFNDLDRFLKAFNARYGEAQSLEEFVFKNQISNYEAMRPMFEAFAVNKYHSTGVIQWMLNSAWPKIIWQLYDYYLVPNAAFYATKKASAPLLPIYNYGNKHIYVNNDHLTGFDGFRLHARVFDIDSRLLFHDSKDFGISPNMSERVMELPVIENLTTTYFLDLRLQDKDGKTIETNFYWLSLKEDTHDWEGTSWIYTPGLEFADLNGINGMQEAEIHVDYEITTDGNLLVAEVILENTSDVIGFFNEFRLVDRHTERSIVPVFWEDNYITLLPGEKRRLKASIDSSLARIEDLVLKAKGWNVSYPNL